MHPDFPKWYLEVNAEPSNELLTARWQGIESLANNMSEELLLALCKSAFGLAKPDTLPDAFGEAFREVDATFDARRSDLEVNLLSAAVLVESMSDDKSDYGLSAALHLSCLSFSEKRINPNLPWLGSYASVELANRSQPSSRESETCIVIPTFRKFADADFEASKEGGDWQQSAEFMFGKLNALLDTINKVSRAASQNVATLQCKLKLYEEESDILWWLFGKQLRRIDKRFDEVDGRVLAFAAARELAELVKVIPGPPSIRAFVKLVLEQSDHTSASTAVQSAVNKIPSKLRSELSQDFDEKIAAFVPLHGAIARSCEGKGWGEGFEHMTGIKATSKVTQNELAMQFYYERLLLRLGGR